MKTTMRFEGGQQLARALSQLSVRVNKNVLRQALRSEAAEPIRDRAASIVARAPGAPDIADHIVVSTGRISGERAAAVVVGPSQELRGDQRDLTYAVQGKYLEFGTSRMRMQAFMRPAFDALSQSSLVRIRAALWAALIPRGIGSGRGSGGGGGTL